MAKISANGEVIGTIETIRGAKRYMSNGKVLINHGHGWKVKGTIKAGVTPAEAYAKAVENHKRLLADHPAFNAFRAAMLEAAPMSKRWRLVLALDLLGNDADGVWSETCDGHDGLDLTVDDVVDICRLYQAAKAESRATAD